MSQPKLHRVPRISRYEDTECSFDENIFCSQCRHYVYEFCSIHGPLLVIPDNKVPTKSNLSSSVPLAAHTLPNTFLHLDISTIPGAGLGVFTSLPLPTGIRFGPYCGQIKQQVNSMYCWQDHKEHTSVYGTVSFYGSEFADMLKVNLAMYNSDKRGCDTPVSMLEDKGQNTTGISHYIDIFGSSEMCDSEKYVNDLSCLKKEYVISNMFNEENRANINHNQIEYDSVIHNFEHTHTVMHTNKQMAIESHCCEFCGKNFTEKKRLNRHKVNVHLKYQLRCSQCSFTTRHSFFYDRHIAKHNKDNIYKCEMCPYSTYTKTYLNRHQKVVHKIRIETLNCNFCGYKCTDNVKYMHHVSTHTTRMLKYLECSFCPYVTQRGSDLKRHISCKHVVVQCQDSELEK